MYVIAYESRFPSGTYTGGAWLSSARVVRCWVKSRNERNPCPVLPAVRPGTHRRLPVSNRRKVGMTSSPHALYILGCTRATMAGTMSCDGVTLSESHQSLPKFGLESATRLHEAGVASNRGSVRRGEYVPGPCTHRPSHHERWQHPQSVT